MEIFVHLHADSLRPVPIEYEGNPGTRLSFCEFNEGSSICSWQAKFRSKGDFVFEAGKLILHNIFGEKDLQPGLFDELFSGRQFAGIVFFRWGEDAPVWLSFYIVIFPKLRFRWERCRKQFSCGQQIWVSDPKFRDTGSGVFWVIFSVSILLSPLRDFDMSLIKFSRLFDLLLNSLYWELFFLVICLCDGLLRRTRPSSLSLLVLDSPLFPL